MANIAVVEDMPLVRKVVCLNLRAAGHTVESFGGFAPAYESLSKSAPDLLVADVNLPDGSGLDLVARLRDLHTEHFPVIITSGLDSASDFKRGFVAGADDYIRKPYPAAELIAKCERHLNLVANAGTERLGLALPGGPKNAFNRYEITSVAGRGNNGIVYHATDLQTGSPVALKVLSVMNGAQEARMRFLREIYSLSSVQSPHIVAVTDYGVSEGRFYYAMDAIHGPNVRDKVIAEGRISEADVRPFLVGLGKALDALHSAGILHRDISPTNVALEDGDWSRPVLLDFGLAKREFDHALTQSDLLLGTPGYMDPEIVRGDPATAKGDLFSLGMLARYAVVAAAPFPDRRGMALINHMSRHSVSIPQELSAPIRILLRSLTQIDPSLRPESAKQLLEVLERDEF